MSYFAFLGYFVGLPLFLLILLAWYDQRNGRHLPASLQSWPFRNVVAAHVIVAVLYTTPWDNYLVATGVWWYDPALVTGIVWGWVPIEEYTFFVVQTIFTSFLLLALGRRLGHDVADESAVKATESRHYRRSAATVLALLWLASVILLASRWRPGTYLGLELVWALPPIIFQVSFGGDILWHYRRLVLWSLLPSTLYLAAADMVAIGAGTWTIDPAQSTGILIGGLPIEEFVFFFVTNTLVVFGTVLVLARASQERVPAALHRYFAGDRQRELPQHKLQTISAVTVRINRPHSNER